MKLARLRIAASARDAACPLRALRCRLAWKMPYQNTSFGNAVKGLRRKPQIKLVVRSKTGIVRVVYISHSCPSALALE